MGVITYEQLKNVKGKNSDDSGLVGVLAFL